MVYLLIDDDDGNILGAYYTSEAAFQAHRRKQPGSWSNLWVWNIGPNLEITRLDSEA